MKVKFKLEKKVYVKLITYISRLDVDQFFYIDMIDIINIRTLYIDAMLKHERWRNDKDYHGTTKKATISMDINLYSTLNKLLCQYQKEDKETYESNLLRGIYLQVLPQIKQQLFLNQQTIN